MLVVRVMFEKKSRYLNYFDHLSFRVYNQISDLAPTFASHCYFSAASFSNYLPCWGQFDFYCFNSTCLYYANVQTHWLRCHVNGVVIRILLELISLLFAWFDFIGNMVSSLFYFSFFVFINFSALTRLSYTKRQTH